MAFNEYENMHSTIRTVDQLLEDIQDLDRAVNQYQWANEKQGDFIRKVYERLGIFQDEEEDEDVNVDACFNKALSELDSRLSYFEGTSQKATERSDRYAEWLDDIEAELFGERIETFMHGDHERKSERMGDILSALEDGAERLMPEDMGWPRYEDGEPVRIGDEVQAAAGGEKLRQLSMCSEGFYLRTDTCDEWHRYGERIKRPAPKVLDADGVEIHVGDTVYGTVDMEYRITSLSEYEPSVVHAEAIEGGNECGDEFIAGNPRINSFQLEASKLTHRAPVLAADGKPLREGETIWRKGEAGTWEIMDIDASSGSVKVRRTDVENGPVVWSFRAFLTHERPDGWELLWLDMHPADKTECVGLDRDEFVRRAKAIAEMGQ